MPRLNKMQAKAVLDEELDRLGLKFPAFEVRDGVRPGADELEWWHERTPAAERSETKYNLAHLRAYIRIAGSETLYAGGIPLERRRLWMDRSVISRLERDEYLLFTPGLHPAFQLTNKGRDWLTNSRPEI